MVINEINKIKYFGKLTEKEKKWLIIRGRGSYSGGELIPIFFNNKMIGGISWNLGGIDYIEFLPEYKGKGYLKYIIYSNVEDDNTVKFVTVSNELNKKLSNYGLIEYNQSNDITTLTLKTY